MKLCVSFSYFRVGMLAEQGAELAQASDTPGPALFLFLARVLFVLQMWTDTELPLTFLNAAQTYIWVRHFTTGVQVPDCAEGWAQIQKDTLFSLQHKKWLCVVLLYVPVILYFLTT